jgi:lysozyme
LTRPVPAGVPTLVKQFEGLKLSRYLDPAGIPTYGWGHVIQPNDPPSPLVTAQAQELLDGDLASAASELCQSLHPSLVISMTDGQYGALVDFVFNEGIGRFRASTMCHFVNTDQLPLVTGEFGKWTYGKVNGVETVLDGLVKRREAEKQMWLS